MGRTACTEPQCLYKGALYPFYPGSVGNVLKELIAENILYFRFSGVSGGTLNGHSSYLTGREFFCVLQYTNLHVSGKTLRSHFIAYVVYEVY